MSTPGYRDLTMTADALFRFLRSVTQPEPLRVSHEVIPTSAAFGGIEIAPGAESADSLITIQVVDQWRGDGPGAGTPLEIIYSTRITDLGTASDWSAPRMLTKPR